MVVWSHLLLLFLLLQRSLGGLVILATTIHSILAFHLLFSHACCYLPFYFSVPVVVWSYMYLLLHFRLFQRSLCCFVILSTTIPSTVFQCSLDCLIILASIFPSISTFPWLYCHTCCYLSFYFSVSSVVFSYLLLL